MAAKKSAPQASIPAKTQKKTLSISIPTRFSQQQILYTLLLVAVFLIGYLIATVQAMKSPSAAAPAAGAQPQGTQQAAPSFTNDDIKSCAK